MLWAITRRRRVACGRNPAYADSTWWTRGFRPRKLRALVGAGAVVVAGALSVNAGSIVGSKHDLTAVISAFGMHANMINNYGEVCVYCHTPHFADPRPNTPLWNHATPNQFYSLYASDTLNTVPGQPGSMSLLCLSCHDGTVAVDAIRNAPGSGTNLGGPWYGRPATAAHWRMDADPFAGAVCSMCHDGTFWGHKAVDGYLGTDLSNDHPIAIGYPTAAQDPEFNPPPDPTIGWPEARLYGGAIECPTCHEPHDPDNTPFLRIDNTASRLCLTCHKK